jgi:hypothetical protein
MLREPGDGNPEARENLQAAKGGRVGSRKELLDQQGQKTVATTTLERTKNNDQLNEQLLA